MSNAEAVKSAPDRLAAIESWTKRTAIASIVVAACIASQMAVQGAVLVLELYARWAAQRASLQRAHEALREAEAHRPVDEERSERLETPNPLRARPAVPAK
jgi:hypothetical protein